MMTRRAKMMAALSALGTSLAGAACASEVQGIAALAGRWGAVLALGPNGLRVILDIVAGQPIALISLDQGNARIPASGGRCSASDLDLNFGSVRAQLKLALTPRGTLAGTFKQRKEIVVEFTRLAAGQMPMRAAPAPFGDLQTEVTAQRLASGVPALAGAFICIKDGATTAREAVAGALRQGEAGAVLAGQKWHVGSITKSMTATLVARLVERGLLAWDMKLSDAFGDLAPDMLPAYRSVTLSRLMTGQSGMPTNVGIPAMISHAASDETGAARRKIWVREALAMTPENAVGQGFVYPNNGYVLAGALCEKITGKVYETLMAEEVFGPLGLTTAGFGPPPLGNPQGHRKSIIGGRLVAVGVAEGEADNAPAMAPAGRAHMSLADLVKFGLAHSEGHQGLRNDYLKQATWQLLHTPPPAVSGRKDYAYGWAVFEDGTLRHNGSNTMWLAELAFDPKVSIAACAAANAADCEEAIGRVLATGLNEARA